MDAGKDSSLSHRAVSSDSYFNAEEALELTAPAATRLILALELKGSTQVRKRLPSNLAGPKAANGSAKPTEGFRTLFTVGLIIGFGETVLFNVLPVTGVGTAV